MAVSIWPKSSCSSREMERNVLLLHGDQLLRQFAAALGKRVDLVEQAAVVMDQISAGQRE